jgi:hypothetical protein
VDQKIYHMGLYKLEYTISMRLGRVAEQCTYATLAPPPWGRPLYSVKQFLGQLTSVLEFRDPFGIRERTI